MKFSNLSLNGRAIVALAFVAVCSRFASADEVTTTAAPTTTLEPGNDNFSLETSRYGSLLLSVPVNGSLGNSSQTFAKASVCIQLCDALHPTISTRLAFNSRYNFLIFAVARERMKILASR